MQNVTFCIIAKRIREVRSKFCRFWVGHALQNRTTGITVYGYIRLEMVNFENFTFLYELCVKMFLNHNLISWKNDWEKIAVKYYINVHVDVIVARIDANIHKE
ncbi:hypothetical protein ACJX0J_027967, partial [Zea mays]